HVSRSRVCWPGREGQRLLSHMLGEAFFRGVAACAEFPNDNPRLHAGAIWACAFVLGPPSPERREMAGPGMKLLDVTVEASERDATGEPRPAAEGATAVDECTPEGAGLAGGGGEAEQDTANKG